MAFIHTSQCVLKSSRVILKLNSEELISTDAAKVTIKGSFAPMLFLRWPLYHTHAATVIPLDDIYGAEVDAKAPNTFTVYALPRVAAKKRDKTSFVFKCDTIEDAAKWVDVLQHVLSGTPLGGMCYDQSMLRATHVFQNPSGARKFSFL